MNGAECQVVFTDSQHTFPQRGLLKEGTKMRIIITVLITTQSIFSKIFSLEISDDFRLPR